MAKIKLRLKNDTSYNISMKSNTDEDQLQSISLLFKKKDCTRAFRLVHNSKVIWLVNDFLFKDKSSNG